ncbi:MAG TPA: hypothetical protein VF904_08310 [Anaeromyxobacteraceae bacterium]
MLKRIVAASVMLAAVPVFAGDASYERLAAQGKQQQSRPEVSKDARPRPVSECACHKA